MNIVYSTDVSPNKKNVLCKALLVLCSKKKVIKTRYLRVFTFCLQRDYKLESRLWDFFSLQLECMRAFIKINQFNWFR